MPCFAFCYKQENYFITSFFSLSEFSVHLKPQQLLENYVLNLISGIDTSQESKRYEAEQLS